MPADAPAATSIERPRVAALAALTAAGVLACGLVAYPFLPALAWAVALAVMAYPLHARVAAAVPHRGAAAGLSTTTVTLLVLVPTLLVGAQLAHEAAGVAAKAEEATRNGRLDAMAEKVPSGPWALGWVRANVDAEAELRGLARRLVGDAAVFAQGAAWAAVQILVCVFVLFFAFRDRGPLLESTRALAPLARAESDYVFARVADSIHATVYATVATSLLQGVTGAVVWWWVGLPAPVLWGTVMFVLGVIPVAGAGLVWAPAAVYLAAESRLADAAILAAWGVVVTGVISNWAYCVMAGDRLRLHPVPVLVSFMGGLAVFGISGMVLGPVALAVTLALLDVWRLRLRGESPATLRAA